MPSGKKIGQYRHAPASEMRAGPDGLARPTLVRRRSPFGGVVLLVYGALGPFACAVVSWLFRAAGGARYLPGSFSGRPMLPSPSLGNVLFGIGLWELVLVSGLVGWGLWSALWKTPLPAAYQGKGLRIVFPALLTRGLLLGPLFTFLALPLAVFAMYLRTAPSEQPWLVRPFFALLAVIPVTLSHLITGVIPLILAALGLLLGAVTAAGVAVLWQRFPEEPVL
jgi:hypothetical protein